MNTEISETMLKNMEVFETVLNEALEELKATRKAVTELQTTVMDVSKKVDGFDQRLQEQKVIASPVDIGPIQETVKENIGKAGSVLSDGLQKINETLERQPKPIIRQWDISLLPDADHYGINRKFYNKILLWFLGLALLLVLFRLGSDYIEAMPTREYVPVVRSPDPPSGFQHHVEKKFKK